MNYYKRLSVDELSQLEDDFVKFLVVNGIVGSDWEKMKTEKPEAADALIDQFSEVIYEASLRKARYLQMVDDHHLRSFHCMDSKITLISMEYHGEKEFSFHQVNDLRSLFANTNSDFKIFSVDKEYAKKREYEMYDMIRSGCKISDGQVYKLLALYWAEINNLSD